MRSRGWRLWLVMALFCGLPAARAADKPAPADGPTRTVEAEGTALVNAGGVPAARQAAIKQALREAVEQTVGVYVTSTTRTKNYVVLEDRIYTHAAGFAVVDQVLHEENDAGTYKVRIRALVSVKPLLDQIRAAGLARQWRVVVSISSGSLRGDDYGRDSRWNPYYYDRHDSRRSASEDRPTEIEIEKRLVDAGFYVVDWHQNRTYSDADDPRRWGSCTPAEVARAGRRLGADVLILGQVSCRVTQDVPVPLPTDLFHISYVRAKAQASVRAIRSDTAEVLAADSFSEDGEATSRSRAQQTALGRVGRKIGDRFTEALLALPAGISRTMQVVASGFDHVADARRFEEALAGVPGIDRVSRQEYVDGRATFDVDVDSETADQLAVVLEEAKELKAFHVHVESDTKSRVALRVARLDEPDY